MQVPPPPRILHMHVLLLSLPCQAEACYRPPPPPGSGGGGGSLTRGSVECKLLVLVSRAENLPTVQG